MNKVLILSNKIPYPAEDGSSIAMARLLEAFEATNAFEIWYYAINPEKHTKNPDVFNSKDLGVHFKHFNWNTSPSVSGAFINLISGSPYHVSRFLIPPLVRELNSFKDQFFDTILLEGAFMGLYFDLAKQKAQRVILRAHNVEWEIWDRLSQNESNPIKKSYLNLQSKRLERFESDLSQKVDAIWTISPKDSIWFKRFNENVGFFPNTVIEQAPPSKIEPKTCHHLGALDWAPNVQGIQWFLDEVWPLVLKQIPEAEFHIAGNNPPNNLAFNTIENVHFHGRVADANQFREAYGISIVPLLAGSGMRIKILELAAQGIPMVSTPIGAEGIFEFSTENNFIQSEPEQMATVLVQLMLHPDHALSQGLKTREDILNRFGMDATLQALNTLWEQ
jgi:glycosyltransferase involved in cell wall biosynthesis